MREYREESAETTPDECLKLAPASCLGGAGGNILPIDGGFHVSEYFAEVIAPLVRDVPFIQSFDLEVGYRWSDYSKTGNDETYKYGFSWRPIDQVLVRVSCSSALHAPRTSASSLRRNTTGLDNAAIDPCSVTNAANIDAALHGTLHLDGDDGCTGRHGRGPRLGSDQRLLRHRPGQPAVP